MLAGTMSRKGPRRGYDGRDPYPDSPHPDPRLGGGRRCACRVLFQNPPVTTVMQIVRFIDAEWLVEIESDAVMSMRSSTNIHWHGGLPILRADSVGVGGTCGHKRTSLFRRRS